MGSALIALLLGAVSAEPAQLPYCAPGCVIDEANLLSKEQVTALASQLQKRAEAGREDDADWYEAVLTGVVIAHVPKGDLDAHARRLLEHWDFGAQGVAVVIDPARGVGLAAGEDYREVLFAPEVYSARARLREGLATNPQLAIGKELPNIFAPAIAEAERKGFWRKGLVYGPLCVLMVIGAVRARLRRG